MEALYIGVYAVPEQHLEAAEMALILCESSPAPQIG
jgi:hypothetical protein